MYFHIYQITHARIIYSKKKERGNRTNGGRGYLTEKLERMKTQIEETQCEYDIVDYLSTLITDVNSTFKCIILSISFLYT